MTDKAETGAIPPDHSAWKACTETRCAGCGYFLQGLSPEGDCPECGVAIEVSVRHWARFRLPVGQCAAIRRGLLFIEVALIAVLASTMLLLMLAWTEQRQLAATALLVWTVTLAAAALVGFLGFIWVTMAPTAGFESERSKVLRLATRILAGATAVACGAMPVARGTPLPVRPAVFLAGIILFLLLGATYSAWLESIAARCASNLRRWARAATTLSTMTALAGGAYIVSLVHAGLRGVPVGQLAVCALILSVAVGLTAAGVLAWLSGALRLALRDAVLARPARSAGRSRSDDE